MSKIFKTFLINLTLFTGLITSINTMKKGCLEIQTEDTLVPTAIPTPEPTPTPEPKDASRTKYTPLVIGDPIPGEPIYTEQTTEQHEEEHFISPDVVTPSFCETFSQPPRKTTLAEINSILQSLAEFKFDNETGNMFKIYPANPEFPYGKKIIFTLGQNETEPKILIYRINENGSNNLVCELTYESI